MNVFKDKKLFPYLEGIMIPAGRVYLVTIARYGSVTIDRDDKRIEKPALWFREFDRGMVLNKTNVKAIVNSYGPDTDKWIGQPVALFAQDVKAFGKTAPALRIGPPDMPGAKAVKPEQAEPAVDTAAANEQLI